MHNTRNTPESVAGIIHGFQPSVLVIITPVLFLCWHIEMFLDVYHTLMRPTSPNKTRTRNGSYPTVNKHTCTLIIINTPRCSFFSVTALIHIFVFGGPFFSSNFFWHAQKKKTFAPPTHIFFWKPLNRSGILIFSE